MSEGKTCSKCGEWKPLEGFYRRTRSKDGLQARCKVCDTGDSKKRKEYRRLYYQRNKERFAEYGYLKRYGITLEGLDQLRVRQGNRCAICKCVPLDKRGLFVDHCHDSDKVRGLLCHNCNTGLGHLKEDLQIINATASYVEKHSWMKGAK